MASCSEFELLIGLQVDDALSTEEEQSLREHLQHCASCRKLSLELSMLHEAFMELPVDPPLDLHARIMKQVELEQPVIPLQVLPPKRSGRVYRRYATTAAALLLLISAVVLGRQQLLPASPLEGNPSVIDQIAPDPYQQDQAAPPQTENETQAPVPGAEEKGLSKPPSDRSTRQTKPPPTKEKQNAAEGANTLPKSTPQPAAEPAPDQSAPDQSPAPNVRSASILSEEDAKNNLQKHLSAQGIDSSELTIQTTKTENGDYLFAYTDREGKAFEYSVSHTDGSVQRISSTKQPGSLEPE